MSTNYYLVRAENPCPTCGHDTSRDFHIGKSSGGWVFAWRGYTGEEGDPVLQGRSLLSPDAWYSFLVQQLNAGKIIQNQYGKTVMIGDFWAMVLGKRGQSRREERSADGERTIRHIDGDDILIYPFS